MTSQDLIDEVLKMVGVVAEADTPTSTKRDRCLGIFNAMLDGWNGEGLLSPYRDVGSYSLVVGTRSYTIGPSAADFTATRPLELVSAEIRDSSNQDSMLSMMSYEEFETIDNPGLANGRPIKIAYQKKSGNGVIKLFPPPDAAYSLRLITSTLFATITLSSVIDNNPGYIEAFKYNLAARVAIFYNRVLDGGIIVLAENALRSLRRKSYSVENAPVASGILFNNPSYDIDRGY